MPSQGGPCCPAGHQPVSPLFGMFESIQFGIHVIQDLTVWPFARKLESSPASLCESATTGSLLYGSGLRPFVAHLRCLDWQCSYDYDITELLSVLSRVYQVGREINGVHVAVTVTPDNTTFIFERPQESKLHGMMTARPRL